MRARPQSVLHIYIYIIVLLHWPRQKRYGLRFKVLCCCWFFIYVFRNVQCVYVSQGSSQPAALYHGRRPNILLLIRTYMLRDTLTYSLSHSLFTRNSSATPYMHLFVPLYLCVPFLFFSFLLLIIIELKFIMLRTFFRAYRERDHATMCAYYRVYGRTVKAKQSNETLSLKEEKKMK